MASAITVFAVLLPISQWDFTGPMILVADIVGAFGLLLAAIFLMRPRRRRRSNTRARMDGRAA